MSFASALNALRPTLPCYVALTKYGLLRVANSLLWKNLLLRTCSALLWEGERGGKKVAVWGGSS